MIAVNSVSTWLTAESSTRTSSADGLEGDHEGELVTPERVGVVHHELEVYGQLGEPFPGAIAEQPSGYGVTKSSGVRCGYSLLALGVVS